MSVQQSLPAGGQGAVGIELRENDKRVSQYLRVLHHDDSAVCVTAERAMNKHLEGGCQVPIAVHGIVADGQLSVSGLVGAVDGSTILRANISGAASDAQSLGIALAKDLLAQGAGAILAEVYGQDNS
jgi:hydroxymethylbilane synthase